MQRKQPVLRSVQEVRALAVSDARAGRSVELEGVVTYLRDASAEQFNFNLNDATGGVMVYPSKLVPLQPGQQVRVAGRTMVAADGLRIQASRLETGSMKGLPEPEPTTVDTLRDPAIRGRYVTLDATLRCARMESPVIQPQRLALDLGPGRERVTAWILHFDPAIGWLVPGARLKLRGVPLHWTNARDQMQSTSLMMNSIGEVELIERPEPAPLLPVAEVLLWVASKEPATRVATTGVVTYVRPGELVVLQDGPHAIRVRPVPPDALGAVQAPPLLGARMEAVGFPTMGEYTVELEDALIGTVPNPDGVVNAAIAAEEFRTATDVLSAPELVDRDGRLIRIRGTLRDVREREEQHALELLSGTQRFTAWLPEQVPLPAFAQTGAELEVMGICSLHLSGERRRLGKPPGDFSLLVPADTAVRLVTSAPWWSRARLLGMLGAVGVLAALSILWAWGAKRRNTLLHAEIARREVAEKRLLSERTRVAGDLHDTLEQTLLAASLQLSAANKTLNQQPSATPGRLSLVGRLLARARQEVRDAVWDLHAAGAENAEGQPLGALLRAACSEAAAGTSVRVDFSGPAEDPFLSALLCAQAVRILRESLGNALKHASPTRIDVCLRIEGDVLRLSIADDGSGFFTATAPGPEAGHFGLSSMRERAQRLGGRVDIRSGSTKGTLVEAVLPITPAAHHS